MKKLLLRLLNLIVIVLLLITVFFSCVSAQTTEMVVNLVDSTKSAFLDTALSLEVDKNNYIWLPKTFSESVNVTNASSVVDAETFYFSDDWETNEECFAYSFTGWKIKGSDKNIPGVTVFQPGDFIDLNEISQSSITLEALWGKVIFIQNEYKTMVYNKYAILDPAASLAGGTTGASDSNSGRKVDKAVATMHHAYTLFDVDNVNYDPYKNVIMLVGNLDYIKSNSTATSQPDFDKGYQSSYWGYGVDGKNTTTYAKNNARNITFKSLLNSNSNYMLKFKPYGYAANFYGATRFDNVDFVLIKGNEITGYSSSITSISGEIVFYGDDSVLEFTNRCTNTRKSGFTLRTNSIPHVSVNGCYFSSWQFHWQTNFANGTKPRYWRVGKNATIGTLTLGTAAQYETTKDICYGDVTLFVNGGTITNIYGANAGMNTNTIGNRYINIRNAKVTNLYGGGNNGPLYGNVFINIYDSNITRVCGGGYAYTATTYGDINVNISNSTIGNIYGGGYNGNTEITPAGSTYGIPGVGGNVKLELENNTKITGSVFGSGMGGTQILSTGAKTSKPLNGGVPDGWEKPASDFPKKDENSDQFVIYQYKTTEWTANSSTTVSFGVYTGRAYLSLATVENVDISIKNSSVTGNVYGGGSIAIVNGDTNIEISEGSVISGNVYGGGDGVTKPAAVTVYKPVPEEGYVAPSYTVNSNGSVTGQSEANSYKNYSLGSFSWSKDTSLLNTNGIDVNKKVIYSPNTEGLGKVKGNTKVIISDSEIKKDVYAGGNSGIVGGNATLELYENTLIRGNAFGGCNTSTVNDTNVFVKNATVSNNLYGGGNNGDILGNSNIEIENGQITSLFGGGNNGNVGGDCTVNIPKANITTIYTGGNNGNVTGNCNLTIVAGYMDTVFGGGNLGTVGGNTEVTVGDYSNSILTIDSLLYGGGRGSSADFETVKGTANVVIEGLNTYVENYGSMKLGKVDGDVTVTFKNYWTGNSTDKYRVMNGIDRATDVYFIDSFVLLENKGENGELEGIKDITNLHIPDGSGLKVSADGEIEGDFVGGGIFYLDSEVCLTVNGDIYGESTLILNPKITDLGNLIKGSENDPYMRIHGTDYSNGNALHSVDSKYTIIHKEEESGAIIYYIQQDVYITETIDNEILNIEGKHYNDDEGTWNAEDFYIRNFDAFSTNFNVTIGYIDDGELGNMYKDLTRFLVLYTGDTAVNIPKGTNIILVSNDENYKYRVTEEMAEIPFIDFVKMSDNLVNFTEVNNVREKAIVVGGNELKKSYQYKEDFRVIVDFSDCEEEDLLEKNPYNLMIKYYDFGILDSTTVSRALNVVRIEGIRKYALEHDLDREFYQQNGIIKLNMVTKTDYDVLYPVADEGKDLMAMVMIKDKDGNIVELPYSMKFTLDGLEINHSNGNVIYKVREGLSKDAFQTMNNLELDMSNLNVSEFLNIGENKIIIRYYIAKNNVLEKQLEEYEIEIPIVYYQLASITAMLKPQNGKTGEELLRLTKNFDTNRVLQLIYIGDVIEPYVEISLQRLQNNSYNEITNSITETEKENLEGLQEIEVNIGNGLSNGKYKLIFDLFDKYGDLFASEALVLEIN